MRDSVFFPVLETLGITLIALIPVITMRVFAEERARGTDELLLTTHLSPTQIVGAKFLVTYGFVVLMMAGSFVYPAMATVEGGIGAEHLLAVFVGLSLHALGLASLGLACSAWSSSQLVAAVASWAAGLRALGLRVGEPVREREQRAPARPDLDAPALRLASPRAS